MKTLFSFCLALIGGLASAVSAAGVTRYVDVNNAAPIAPYTNWATAATVIQHAVDVALPGDEIFVTNGVYEAGGRVVGTNVLVNRVAVTKPVKLRSVNGPEFTVIRGHQVPGTTNGVGAIRCVYLANGAAPTGANHLGFNIGWISEGVPYIFSTLDYSCTTPMPPNGAGNITNAPWFIDTTAGNFRLQSNSPCINAGRNAYAPAGSGLDSNPRLVGGTVDIGAYEFQSPRSALSYAWLQQYGLPTGGSVDFADLDADGHNNWQEWRA